MIVARFVRKASGFRPHTIVHVGASRAQELDHYEALGPKRVVWIEADSTVASEMKTYVERNGAPGIEHVCIEALVADADGEDMTFNVFSNGGASSSVFKSTQVLRDTWPDVAETGEVRTLRTSRLETLLQNLSIEPDDVDVLIVDTQGAELLCLRGAGEYLNRLTFVEVEASQVAIYEGGVLFPDLDGYLSGAGFSRVSPVPWHGDVVYVRKTDLQRPGFRRLRRYAAAPDRQKRGRRTPGFLRRMLGRT